MYLLFILRESLPSGFVFTLWSQPDHRTINMTPPEAPRSHSCITVFYLLGLLGVSSPLSPRPQILLLLQPSRLEPSLPKGLTAVPVTLSFHPCCLSPGSGHCCVCPTSLLLLLLMTTLTFLGERPLLHSLRLDGASNHIVSFFSDHCDWPRDGHVTQSQSLPGILYMEHRKKHLSLSLLWIY